MPDRPTPAETAPGLEFTFQANMQPERPFDATAGPDATVTACPPLSMVRHLLTGKPHRGVRRLPKGPQSP